MSMSFSAAEIAATRAAAQDVDKLEQQWQQLQTQLPILNQTLRRLMQGAAGK